MSGRPFARLYYVDLRRDYPEVWKDNDLFATYSRLLSLADATWPVVPEVPRSEKRPHVERLIATSLVQMVSEFGYQIKGFDAERSARSNAASTAARIGWASRRADAPAYARAMPTPVQSNTTPSLRVIDPQKLSPEEQAAGVIAAQERLTGVKL